MTEKDFLKAQLEIRRKIKDGDASWNDLNLFRIKNGKPSVNVDTLRKGSFLLDEYDNSYFVQIIEDNDSAPMLSTTVSMDRDGNITYDNKTAWLSSDELKNKDAILKAYGFSPEEFDLINVRTSHYGVKVNDDGRSMYSARITVRPKSEDELSLSAISEHFEEYFKNHIPLSFENKEYEYGTECLIPCIFDLHFGKLACVSETGNKYDYKIAKERFLYAINGFVNKMKQRGKKFEKIIFPFGNDFFNSESDNETANGTRQDNDTRPTKMFEKGVETVIEGIEILTELAPVEVVLVQGNHDFMTSFYAACVLYAYFKNSKNVIINKNPITRKYIQFGSNLIGLTHGSEEKDRIYGLMQHEVPEMWGNTTTREWLIGHLHHESVTEKNGVIVRRIPSLTGGDAWHQKTGFTGSKKRAVALIYDKEEGLSEMHYITI